MQCTIATVLADSQITPETREFIEVSGPVALARDVLNQAGYDISGWVISNHRRGIQGGYSTGCRCAARKDTT